MRMLKYKRRYDRFLLNVFIPVIICVSLTIIILCSVTYFLSSQYIIHLMSNYMLNQLENDIETFDNTINDALITANNIFNDRTISQYYNPNVSEDTLIKIFKRVQEYLYMNPQINSVYLYNNRSEKIFCIPSQLLKVYSKDDFYDKSIFNLLYDTDTLKPYSVNARTITKEVNGKRHEFKYHSFIVFSGFKTATGPDYAVIVNIDASWLSTILKNKATTIYDREGAAVTTSGDYPFMSHLSKQSVIYGYLSSSKAGYVLGNIEGKSVIVEHSQPSKYGFYAIKLIPLDEVTGFFNVIRTNTLILASVLLAIGIILQFTLGMRLAKKPVEVIFDYVNRLELEVDESNQYKKSSYLLGLLESKEPLLMSSVKKNFDELKIPFSPDKGIYAVRFILDNINVLKKTFSGDFNSVFVSLKENAADILSKHFFIESIDNSAQKSILFLLGEKQTLSNRELIDDIEQIQHTAKDKYGISVSAIFSEHEYLLEEIGNLYNKINNATNYKLFYGENCLIDADEIVNKEINTVVHSPFEKGEETSLEIYIREGNSEAAKRLYTSIMNRTLDKNFFHIDLTVNLIKMKLAALTINAGLHELPETDTLKKLSILNYQTMEELNDFLLNYIDLLSRTFKNGLDTPRANLIKKADNIIQNNYSNYSLSVQSIADELDISLPYLSKLYKSLTGKNIVDVITHKRLAVAIDLLLNTRLTMNDIAVQSGFTSSAYFSKVFKKEKGCTPSLFRQTHQNVPG